MDNGFVGLWIPKDEPKKEVKEEPKKEKKESNKKDKK